MLRLTREQVLAILRTLSLKVKIQNSQDSMFEAKAKVARLALELHQVKDPLFGNIKIDMDPGNLKEKKGMPKIEYTNAPMYPLQEHPMMEVRRKLARGETP